MMKAEELKLTEEWDKVFPKSEKVEHRKVTFINHFGITLAADMYTPKNAEGKLAAVTVSGPFGAVKEQSSGLYAQEMAERGFLAIAFDPSFTGESGGFPRDMHSPDIDVEDFQAAVDFLSVQENVDPEKIGIIGICGWGGMALQTACIDTRIKATVTSTMYDMSRVAGNGYFDSTDNEEARHQARVAVNTQRTADYKNGDYAKAGGVVDPPCLLQDVERISCKERQFQQWMECYGRNFPHEYAAIYLRKGNPQRGADGSRREGAFLLSFKGCLCRYGKGQQLCR